MLQSSGVETGLVILPAIDTAVARHKVEFSSFCCFGHKTLTNALELSREHTHAFQCYYLV
jgi:hypothetical protein